MLQMSFLRKLLFIDESMEILYGGGHGAVYKASLRWLGTTNTQLQMAGALAIGNFARNGRWHSFVRRIVNLINIIND